MVRAAVISVVTLALATVLTGCSSLAAGVVRGLMESEEPVDERACHVKGPPFPGLSAHLDRQAEMSRVDSESTARPVLKVLMVHGIGNHAPGYATQLMERLARALDLRRQSRDVRNFQLENTKDFPGDELGVLRATRFESADSQRGMIFYELTWDAIVEEEKQTIAYDSAEESAFRRAVLNNTAKLFFNDTVPDMMMYQGASRRQIQYAVGQALCWMYSADWASLPGEGRVYCDEESPEWLGRIDDDYAFISHSLGSRILTDALQTLAREFGEMPAGPVKRRIRAAFDRRQTLYLLSNQMPLLQLGQSLPPVTGMSNEICTEGAPRSSERLFENLELVAFSDPNDLLSYTIPQGYVDRYLDSRLCPSVVNVVLNVAAVNDLFGVGELANPATAHLGYDSDERVVALITNGIGGQNVSPLVAERCEWIETF